MTGPEAIVPGWIVPPEPDLRPLMLLHRRHDGCLTFHRMDNGRFTSLYGVPASDLDGVFPQLLPDLDADSYASVNGMLMPRGGTSQHSPPGLMLPVAYRSNNRIRYLTSAFADVDCHNLGITYGEAVGGVIDLQEAGAIPPVSMFQRSGRGLWCYWFLRDRHDDAAPRAWPAAGPVRAWPEKVELWAAVQVRIGELLADLGSDAAARDAARVSRVAGSLHSKAQLRVGYFVALSAEGKPFFYTLGELANLLGVRLKPMTDRVAEIDARLAAWGQKGAAGRWRHDLRRFRTLWTERKTWRVGMRNRSAWVYATILRSLRREDRLSPAEIAEELKNLFLSFEQPADDPYTLDELQAVLDQVVTEAKSKGTGRPLRHQTIADRLDVTPEESEVCGWPAASRFRLGLPDVQTANKVQQAKARRDALRGLLGALKGRIPTCREAANYLADLGLDAAPATVLADFKALGIANPRARKRRRRRCAPNSERKLFPE